MLCLWVLTHWLICRSMELWNPNGTQLQMQRRYFESSKDLQIRCEPDISVMKILDISRLVPFVRRFTLHITRIEKLSLSITTTNCVHCSKCAKLSVLSSAFRSIIGFWNLIEILSTFWIWLKVRTLVNILKMGWTWFYSVMIFWVCLKQWQYIQQQQLRNLIDDW